MFFRRFNFCAIYKARYAINNDLQLKHFSTVIPKLTHFTEKPFVYKKSSLNEGNTNFEEDEAFNLKLVEIEVYKSHLSQNDMKTLTDIINLQSERTKTADIYSRILTKLHQLKNISYIRDDHLCDFINFLGSSIFRKLYANRTFDLAKRYVIELKNRDTIMEILSDPVKIYTQAKKSPTDGQLNYQLNFLMNKLPNIILNCSNMNYYDQEFFKSYQDFLEHQSIEMLIDSLQIKTALAIFWSYKRLNRGSPKLYQKLIELFEQKENAFSDQNCLRLLWMLSIDHEDMSSSFINKLIKRLLENMRNKALYSYNPKNVNQIIQFCYFLYPALLKNIHYDIETGEVSEPTIAYETLYKQLKAENNPYLECFSELYKVFQTSQILVAQNTSQGVPINNKTHQLAYLESNHNGKSYYILKPKLILSESKFENNVKTILETMEGVKWFHSKRMGIYEIDFIIYPDTILEVSGEMHYVRESDQELMMNYTMKLQ